MNNGLIYLQTYGCQMNVLDSELVTGQLRSAGFDFIDKPEEADVILLNTCSVRRHAEERVYSNLGAMKRLAKRPVIGIIGCMAEAHRLELFRRFPYVSVLCGAGHLHRLPLLIAEAQKGRRALALEEPRARTDREKLQEEDRRLDQLEADRPTRPTSTAYLRIMRGCDRFCSYCVVPFVRGPERSRPPGQILTEARRLIESGCRQITLLGQTVNSYKHTQDGRGWRLADLLYKLSDIEGLSRLTFVTSHPCDFTEDLAQAMAASPKVMPYLHLPAQSGSDEILRKMNRGYTAAGYAQRVAMARRYVPDIAVASDFIVGFPGETDHDFEATCALCRKMRFSGGFVFKYSPRPGTAAAKRWPDDISDQTKRERNNQLLALLGEISLEDNQKWVGQRVNVLVEGPSEHPSLDDAGHTPAPLPGQVQLTSRALTNHIVVFNGPESLTGQEVAVRIVAASALTLFGLTDRQGATG